MTAASATLTTTHRSRSTERLTRELKITEGRFGANSAWVLCAAIAHNLLRAVGTLAGRIHAVARGATLRRRIVNVAARLARPQRRPVLHLPSHWPWSSAWLALWHNIIGQRPPPLATTA